MQNHYIPCSTRLVFFLREARCWISAFTESRSFGSSFSMLRMMRSLSGSMSLGDRKPAQVNTFSTYVFVVLIVSMLHLIALNLLYPKIVGSRVHLNPLVVTFSLMLWGFLWDAAGLLLAIPLTAGLKAVCDNVKELRPIGKFLGD